MRTRGFTLAEMLVVIVLMATLAATAIPQYSSLQSDQLDIATAEVRAALRFAQLEALQRGAPVLVDMETQANTVKLLQGTCDGPGAPVLDPRTGRDFVVDLSQGPHTSQVALNAQVLADKGRRYEAWVIDASGSFSEACDLAKQKDKGSPEPGSQVVLSLGDQQMTLRLWPTTGRVSGP